MYWFHSPDDFYVTWLSNILAVCVPDECYSRNTSCALNLISRFLLMIINHISTSENLSVYVLC